MADLIAQFLEHLNAERALSPNTIVSKGFDLRQFCEYEPTEPLGRSAAAIRAFLESRLASDTWPEPPADNWPLYAPSMNSVSSKALSRELYRARHTRQEEKQVWDTEHKMD